MAYLDELPIVREGIWLYCQSVPVCVRVLASPVTFGSGDYEDEEVVAENQPIPCFLIVYESAGSPGHFNNVLPNIESLEAAYKLVDERFSGIKWAPIRNEHVA